MYTFLCIFHVCDIHSLSKHSKRIISCVRLLAKVSDFFSAFNSAVKLFFLWKEALSSGTKTKKKEQWRKKNNTQSIIMNFHSKFSGLSRCWFKWFWFCGFNELSVYDKYLRVALILCLYCANNYEKEKSSSRNFHKVTIFRLKGSEGKIANIFLIRDGRETGNNRKNPSSLHFVEGTVTVMTCRQSTILEKEKFILWEKEKAKHHWVKWYNKCFCRLTRRSSRMLKDFSRDYHLGWNGMCLAFALPVLSFLNFFELVAK